MKNGLIKPLSDKYPQWSFTSDSNEETLLIARSNDDSSFSKTLEIVREIYLFFDEDHIKILIEKKDSFVIKVVRTKVASKYRRMYTSGCFDIFHYGHLNILKKSKEMCDYLIVGVSTDELIKKEKGKYPIIPFSERINVVNAIGFVDQVIPQTDKNKQRIVDEYDIDAISVGDDWKGRFPPTSCPVEYFPYTANVSSTILKDTLQLQQSKI